MNARQSQKMTALMFAAKQGHCKLVKFLVTQGQAEVNFKDSQEWTALCFAADQGKKLIKVI